MHTPHPRNACRILLSLLTLIIAAPAFGSELRVAVSEFQINAGEDLDYIQAGLRALLPPRISLPGKISVVDSAEVRRTLGPARSDYSTETKARLAETLNLDYLVTGSITKIGTGISIDAFLFDAASPERSGPQSASCAGLNNMIDTVQELAGNLQRRMLGSDLPEPGAAPAPDAGSAQAMPKPQARELPVPPPAPPRRGRSVSALRSSPPVFEPEPFREYIIKHRPFICMAAADLTGQGKQQLLFADHLDVTIYDPSPQELVLQATVQAHIGEYIVNIDTFDLNANGRAEVYVSSYPGGAANSFIAEYNGEAFERTSQNLPWLMRVYPDERGWVLLGVKPGTYNPFFGSAFEFIWKDNETLPGAEYPLPGGVSPFGSSRCDIGDNRDTYIAFSRGIFGVQYGLHVMSSTGKILWKDTKELGGAVNTYPRDMVGDGASAEEPIPLRVYSADINGDTRADILLPNNSKSSDGFLGRLGSYSRGEMLCLHWDGTSLSQNWSSGVMDGYISDFLVTDIDGDGLQELLVLSITGHSLSGKASNIVRVYKQAR